MGVINLLSPLVADMIAAGEVVERPGSVVKELMENALDAGARNITVELRGGGCTLIRVTDDGCGMEPDDAGNCFLRHATSKLADERGLEAIETMGFRGEALAAISAVSRITLTTRRRGAPTGTRVKIAGGELLSLEETGCPEGTTLVVEDLFYNTPARLKFLRSDRAEGGFCEGQALRVALGRPDCSVRCIRDGKECFFTPGDGRVDSAVYALLGRDTARTMLTLPELEGDLRVRGCVSSPAACRGNRSQQFFFCNGRAIRSQQLQAAVEQAYRNADSLLTGRFPAAVLYLTISPGSVDVNVHPTKAEVRFSAERLVFAAVYDAVTAALLAEKRTVSAPEPVPMRGFHAPAQTPSYEQLTLRAPDPLQSPAAPVTDAPVTDAPAVSAAPVPSAPSDEKPAPANDEPVPAPQPEPPTPRAAASIPSAAWSAPAVPGGRAPIPAAPGPSVPSAAPSGSSAASSPAAPAAPTPPAVPQPPAAEPPAPRAPAFRVIGEVMKTYIVVDTGEAMVLIDKHAAHERILFDRLKKNAGPVMQQTLLVPELFRPTQEDYDLLLGRTELLGGLGFELEAYGPDALVLRAVPCDMDAADGPAALEEIAEKLRRGAENLARDHVLQTVACKAAIKAGRSSDLRELQALAERVMSGEIRYCPHGRPVAVTVSRDDLDRRFKRIV